MLEQLSIQEAENLLNDDKVIIADVRDQGSYQAGHIKNAIHLSIAKLQEFCDQEDKSMKILVYCYHGISSQSVAQHLIEQGFSEVYSLVGGYEAWKQKHPAQK